jgi:hypothetical protein
MSEHPLQAQITEASFGLMGAGYWVEGDPQGGEQTLYRAVPAQKGGVVTRARVKVLAARDVVGAILEAWTFVRESS